jgi:hypothetical protein
MPAATRLLGHNLLDEANNDHVGNPRAITTWNLETSTPTNASPSVVARLLNIQS